MDVLILSVAAGGGHMKAAEAIKEEVLSRYPNSRTEIIDTLRYVNPIFDKLIVGSYLGTIKKKPEIYGKLYYMSEYDSNIQDFSSAVNKILSFKLKKLINEFKPSVIACTHPFPLQMITNLKSKKRIDIPVAGIITDYAIHSLWPDENLEAYIVAHEYLKGEMVKRGYSSDIIYPYGIPVSRAFLKKKNKDSLLEELGLENRLTVLIMGGSLGFGEIKDVFKSLVSCSRDMQIIVITGKNKKLRTSLENISTDLNNQHPNKIIKILSYTDRVSDYMDISDFIITKPGGMTISEALVKQLPMFLLSPIPGQEERNAHFLINNGAAARILLDEDMDSFLYLMIDGSPRLKQMKEMAGYLAKPYAARDTVDLLLSLLN